MSDPLPNSPPSRGRWVAIITGAISILIGVLYLVLIVVLDSRGPLQPPPPHKKYVYIWLKQITLTKYLFKNIHKKLETKRESKTQSMQ